MAVSAVTPQIFEQFPACTWQAKGKPAIQIPAKTITEEWDNGLIKRKRPYKRGSKLDNTAGDSRVWNIEALYSNSITEPGMPPAGVYPNMPNDLVTSFEIQETGTLTLPTRGAVRCQAKSYRRVERDEDRDLCAISMVFWEDTEDDITAAAFNTPSARAVAVLLSENIGVECDAAGIGGSLVTDLKTFLAQLEGMLLAPSEYADQISAKINAVFVAAGRLQDAFMGGTTPTGEPALLATAETSRLWRLLTLARYLAVDSATDSLEPVALTFVRYPNVVSIFDVASILSQDAAKLIELNPDLGGDLLAIPPRTRIKVYA